MAELINGNPNRAVMQVLVWREPNGRIHVVGYDEDLPNNGMHWNPSRHIASYDNLEEMLNNLAAQEILTDA